MLLLVGVCSIAGVMASPFCSTAGWSPLPPSPSSISLTRAVLVDAGLVHGVDVTLVHEDQEHNVCKTKPGKHLINHIDAQNIIL